MPIKRRQTSGKPGYKWGDEGKCYPYEPGNPASRDRAKGKALQKSPRHQGQEERKPT